MPVADSYPDHRYSTSGTSRYATQDPISRGHTSTRHDVLDEVGNHALNSRYNSSSAASRPLSRSGNSNRYLIDKENSGVDVSRGYDRRTDKYDTVDPTHQSRYDYHGKHKLQKPSDNSTSAMDYSSRLHVRGGDRVQGQDVLDGDMTLNRRDIRYDNSNRHNSARQEDNSKYEDNRYTHSPARTPSRDRRKPIDVGSKGSKRSPSRSRLADDESDSDDHRSLPPPTTSSAVPPRADNASSGGGAKKRKKKNITANLSGTKYEVVRTMAEHVGFSLTREEDHNSYLIWNDSFVSTERISELKPYQRINHFPGMGEICRKDCLARNMAKMARVLPDEYGFVPRTWIFPVEYSAFQTYARELKKKKKSKTFIVKPTNGAMGNGIALYRNADKIPQNEHIIVQEYIDKPFLVDGYKCDMRIYVLVTSCDPLRVFLYNDGLLRMGTEHYVHPSEHNIDQLFMHLTNYSVNKHSETYQKSATIDSGSKRTLKFFNDYLRRNDYDVSFIWKNIVDMIVKTVLVVHPHVLHAYRMCRPGQAPGSDSVCFEILGFDFMLDRKLRPWLLEINRSPSFGTDEKLDYDIKSGLIEDTLRLINIRASDKRKNLAAQKAQTQRRLMRPHKRIDNETSELEKKRQNVEKKKEELKDLLVRLRKDSAREDYENRHCGRFKRIFPSDDRFRREHYTKIMSDVFGAFVPGRTNSLCQEVTRTYKNQLREEDILDLLAQCEADEKDGHTYVSNRGPRGPKPLTGMPTLSKETERRDSDEESDDDYHNRHAASRPTSKGDSKRQRSGGHRFTKVGSKVMEDVVVSSQTTQREREEEATQRTLSALNDMRIKFPGKNDEEAEVILDKLHENWKFHKPRIASYWLVKLDSIKRRKVIDIVRSNVRAVLQRTWRTSDIEGVKLYRIFSRVFNRLLWSHGQGLWNCFQNTGHADNSWETIFSKSSEPVTSLELNCCRRVVQLCRDCLLIVYQFAAEAKGQSSATTGGGSQSNLSVETDPNIRRTTEQHTILHHNSLTSTPRISAVGGGGVGGIGRQVARGGAVGTMRGTSGGVGSGGIYTRSASMGSLHTAS